MAKSKVDRPDDNLDFNFEEFNFDEPAKDDRNVKGAVAKSAISGVADGFISKITSQSMMRSVYDEVLPPDYARAADTAGRLISGVKSNAFYAKKQLAGPIRQAKALVNSNVNRLEGKLPKGVVDRLKSWSADTRGRSASASELAEASITNELNGIFGAQHAMAQRERAEDTVRASIADAKDDARHSDAMSAATRQLQALEKLANYQDTVTIGYQRKSLELQMRHYAATLEAINVSKQGTEVMVANLQSIATNTALPEFLKLKNSERFREVMRTNFMNKMGDRVFGGTDFTSGLMSVIRSRGKAQVDKFAAAFEDAVSSASMLGGMADMLPEDMTNTQKLEMGGGMVGGVIGDSLASKAGKMLGKGGKWVLDKVDPNKKHEKFGRGMSYVMDNPNAGLSMANEYLAKKTDATGVKLAESDTFKGAAIRAILGFAEDLQSEINRPGQRNMVVGNINDFGKVGQLTYGAVRSIEEIIPGWLQRIHHNTAIMATGNPATPPLSYDFSRGQFVTGSKGIEGIKNILFSDSDKQSLKSEQAGISGLLDPDGKMDPELKKKLNALILSDNTNDKDVRKRGDTTKFSRLTDPESWKRGGITDTEAEMIANLFKGSLGEEFSRKHVNVAKQMNRVGMYNADKREAVQALINTGNVDLLRRIGLVDKDDNYDPKRYLELLNQDKIDFGADETFLGSKRHARRRKFAIGGLEDPIVLPTPNEIGTDPRVQPTPEAPLSVSDKGVAGLIKNADKNTKKVTDRLDMMIKLSQEAMVNISNIRNVYEFGLSTPFKMMTGAIGKGLSFGGKALKRATGYAGKAVTLGSDVIDWGRKKLDTFHDVFLEGEVKPRLEAWQLKAGKYRDAVTGEIIRNYTDIKNGVVDENGNLILDPQQIKLAFVRTPIGRKAITALGAGKSAIKDFAEKHALLGAPLRMTRSLWMLGGTVKDRVLDNVAGKFDIYVGKEEQPRLFAYKLRMGHYRIKDTGEVIKNLKQITGDVVDEENRTVMRFDEVSDAYYRSTLGRTLLSAIIKAPGKIKNFVSKNFGTAQGLASKAWEMAKDLLDAPIDIYVNYDMTTPRLLAVTMEAGGYINDVNNELVLRPSHIVGQVRRIHDNKVMLTESDLSKMVDVKGNKIKSVGQKLFGLATSQLKLAKDLTVRGYKYAKEKLSTALGKVAGFFGDVKGIDLTGFYDWISSNPIVDKLTDIHQLLDARLPGGKQKVGLGEVRDKNGKVRKIGDQDGDGDVDGSNADKAQQDKDKPKGKVASALEKAKDAAAAWRDRKKKSSEDGGGLFDKIKEYIGGALAAVLGGKIMSSIAGLFGGGAAAAGTAAAGTAAAGTAATAAGTAAAGTAAAGAGAAATAAGGAAAAGGVAAAAGKGGLLRTLGRGAWSATKMAGRAAWWLTKASFKPTGLLLRAGMAALPFIGAGVGAVLSSPLLIPALVVGTVGYGIYKFATRLKIGNTMKMRMAQYGFAGRDDKKIKAVCEFEETIFDQVKYDGGQAKLDKTNSDEDLLKKVRDLFGIDEKNNRDMAKFARWYNYRFKPVYLAHLTVLNKLNVKTRLKDVESMPADIKLQYIQATRALAVDFTEIQSPFPEHTHLESSAVDVSNYAEMAIKEARKENPEAVVPPETKTPETMANGKPLSSPQSNTPMTPVSNVATAGTVDATREQSAANAVLPSSNTVITPTAMIIATSENTKVGGLDAVRYRAYGLHDLEPAKVEGLRTAERLVIKHVKPGAEKRVIFDSDLVRLGTDLAPVFGVNPSDTGAFVAMVNWLRDRFLPVYLNYASCLNVICGKYDERAQLSMTPTDIYNTAIYLRDTKDIDGKSIWGMTSSPWKGYAVNTDPTSVLANVEFLKERSTKTKALDEQKIDNVAEKAKKAEAKTAANITTPTMGNDKPGFLARFGNSVQEAVGSANYHFDNLVDKAKNVFDAPTGPNVGKSTSAMGIETNALPTNAKISGDNDLATLIHLGESKRRGYNDYNRGSSRNAPSNKENIDLTNMTLEEIMRKQSLPEMNPDRLFAVGKYQIVTKTLREAVRSLGLNVSEKFTPALQERIFAEFLATRKKGRKRLENFIKGKSDDVDGAITDTALEWASVQKPDGRGAYDGVGVNHAGIPAASVKNALTKARAKYAELVKSGMDESRAYGVAIGAYKGNGTPAGAAASAPGATPTSSTAAATTPTPGGAASPTTSSTAGYTPTASSDAAKRGRPSADTTQSQGAKDATKSFVPAASPEKAAAINKEATDTKREGLTNVAYTPVIGSKLGSQEQASNMAERSKMETSKPSDALATIASEVVKHTTLLSDIKSVLTTIAGKSGSPTTDNKPAVRPVNQMFSRGGSVEMPVDLGSSGLI